MREIFPTQNQVMPDIGLKIRHLSIGAVEFPAVNKLIKQEILILYRSYVNTDITRSSFVDRPDLKLYVVNKVLFSMSLINPLLPTTSCPVRVNNKGSLEFY